MRRSAVSCKDEVMKKALCILAADPGTPAP